MRALPLLLALAGSVLAAPSIRWIDKFGNVHAEAVEEVLGESVAQVRVRLAEGRTVTLAGMELLALQRERDEVPEEHALLLARLDAAAGERLDAARPVLDRIAEKGGEAWMREYAAAARAILAERAGEEDAADRIAAFLEQCADSRFVPAVMRAQARAKTRGWKDDQKIMAVFWETRKAIAALDGCALDRFGTYIDVTTRVAAFEPTEIVDTMGGPNAALSEQEAKLNHAGLYLVCESSRQWARLAEQLRMARLATDVGAAPIGPALRIERLLDESGLLLPELQCDLHYAAGTLRAKAGQPAPARAHLKKALELASDPRRRTLAERALADLPEAGGAGAGGR